MSSSNCCFLTCIRISWKAGKGVWYSHLLKNFPHLAHGLAYIYCPNNESIWSNRDQIYSPDQNYPVKLTECMKQWSLRHWIAGNEEQHSLNIRNEQEEPYICAGILTEFLGCSPRRGKPGGSQLTKRVEKTEWKSGETKAARVYTGCFPGGASGKEPTRQCRRHKRHGFHPLEDPLE